jgi:hypothetical protein
MASVERARASGEPLKLSKMSREALKRGLKTSVLAGRITAAVFLKGLQLKIHRPKQASVGMATFLVSRMLEGQREDGKLIPADRDNIHKQWVKCRPAAHIWGASHYLIENGLALSYDDGWFPNRIFDTAQALLEAAKGVDWRFDEDPWELPEGYPRRPVKIVLPAPDTHTIELMKKYRAPVRPKG